MEGDDARGAREARAVASVRKKREKGDRQEKQGVSRRETRDEGPRGKNTLSGLQRETPARQNQRHLTRDPNMQD